MHAYITTWSLQHHKWTQLSTFANPHGPFWNGISPIDCTLQPNFSHCELSSTYIIILPITDLVPYMGSWFTRLRVSWRIFWVELRTKFEKVVGIGDMEETDRADASCSGVLVRSGHVDNLQRLLQLVHLTSFIVHPHRLQNHGNTMLAKMEMCNWVAKTRDSSCVYLFEFSAFFSSNIVTSPTLKGEGKLLADDAKKPRDDETRTMAPQKTLGLYHFCRTIEPLIDLLTSVEEICTCASRGEHLSRSKAFHHIVSSHIIMDLYGKVSVCFWKIFANIW